MKKYIVITSIQSPNSTLKTIAEKSNQFDTTMVVIGDRKSPSTFELDQCRFLSVDQQLALPFAYAKACPENTYARKNIGYLLAMSEGAESLLETDDDNIPWDSFFAHRQRTRSVPVLNNEGWINVYGYFFDGDQPLWPRGFPLDGITPAHLPDLPVAVEVDAPIQQYLADGDPDVDAIFRLLFTGETRFKPDLELALGENCWCPFNSQNTLWWPEAFPLMYLPAYCSFRMTDIFRSFIAQRIAWTNGWSLYFGSPTVYQERNEHNLIRDFEQEIDGYLNNRAICAELENLDLSPGVQAMRDNMIRCYEVFIRHGVVEERELSLLTIWHDDLERIGSMA